MRSTKLVSPTLAALAALASSLCACNGPNEILGHVGTGGAAGTGGAPSPSVSSTASSTGSTGTTSGTGGTTVGTGGTTVATSSTSTGTGGTGGKTTSAPSACDPGLPAPPLLPTGTQPDAVIAADLNGDGKPDIAIANAGDATVSVFLAQGTGSFAAPAPYAVGLNPMALAAADLNGDGKLDLAVADHDGNTVSLLLNMGNGVFAPAVPYDVGTGPMSLVLADLNGDGKADLIVANAGDETVDVLLGNGDGSFAMPKTTALAAGATALAVGDLDGDGKPDLAVVGAVTTQMGSAFTGTVTLSVLRNLGAAAFAAPVSYPIWTGGQLHALNGSIALGDLDGDGKLDVAVGIENAGNPGGGASAYVLRNQGDGTLGSAAGYATGEYGAGIIAADLDGDGALDLATDGVAILFNKGDGTFKLEVEVASADIEGGVGSLAVADLNGDGKPDLVTSGGSVLVNQGKGQYPSSTHYVGYTGPGFASRQELAVEDLSGDGSPDLVMVGPGVVSVRLGKGDGTYASETATMVMGTPTAVAVGDLNGDAKPDIAVALQDSAFVGILLNTGAGVFAAPVYVPTGQDTQKGASYAVQLGDLDGDGKLDVAVAGATSGTVSVLRNQGNGTFAPAVAYAVGTTPLSLAIGDMNADGKPDLVAANQASDSVSVLLNQGNGTFAAAVGFPVTKPLAVKVGDLDGDGKLDIAVAGATSDPLVDQVSVLHNQGNATFAGATTYPVGRGALSLAVGDLNGDGWPELAVVNQYLDLVRVLRNQGDGTFAQAVSYAVSFRSGGTMDSVAMADVNADGELDVLVRDGSWGQVDVLLNAGSCP